MAVLYQKIPFVREEDRVEVEPLGDGFYRPRVYFGFMDKPDLVAALMQCAGRGLDFDLQTTSFFVSHETIVPTKGTGMANWRESLFAAMTRMAGGAFEYLNVPSSRVIAVGTLIEI